MIISLIYYLTLIFGALLVHNSNLLCLIFNSMTVRERERVQPSTEEQNIARVCGIFSFAYPLCVL